MSRFGFIGFGSMAKMLIGGLIRFAGVAGTDIIVTRKSSDKFTEINEIFPDVQLAKTPADVVKNAEYVFICTKPMDVKAVLLEIKQNVGSGTHVVVLAGTVKLDDIESVMACKVSKLIPTVTSEIGEGISLVCHGTSVTQKDKKSLHQYIACLGGIKEVDDQDIGFAAELTSCMPGFIASIFDNMAKAAALHTQTFDYEAISEILTYTVLATAKMLQERDLTYREVVERVATKGGITQEGVAVFEEMLPPVFEAMFSRTLQKRALMEQRITEANR